MGHHTRLVAKQSGERAADVAAEAEAADKLVCRVAGSGPNAAERGR